MLLRKATANLFNLKAKGQTNLAKHTNVIRLLNIRQVITTISSSYKRKLPLSLTVADIYEAIKQQASFCWHLMVTESREGYIS